MVLYVFVTYLQYAYTHARSQKAHARAYRKMGDPIDKRFREWEAIPEAEAALKGDIDKYMAFVSSKDKAFDHISV